MSAAVASDPEVKAFVERLESAADEVQEDQPDEESLPSADTIARDFQRFLRQRDQETLADRRSFPIRSEGKRESS